MSEYNDLLAQQSEILETIKRINANFKKDGASRKSSDYLQLRLDRLEVNWEKFDFNNNKILALLGDKKREGSYFENNVYVKVKELYVGTKNMIECFNSLKLGENDDSDEVEGLSELLNEQGSNIKAFERTIHSLNLDESSERWYLEDQLKTINSRWEKLDTLYWKLDNIVTNPEAYEKDYNRLEEMYKDAKASINSKIWAHTHQQKSTPKIELPIFSGSYAQWITFKDLYTETVHLNSFISKAQKMQHLKSKLRGEAERLVQHLHISAENYDTCWSMLQQRYDNIRLLFSYHANILLSQPIIQQPSAVQIKRMHDTTLESLHAISNLQIDISNWDPLIIHILLQKLDTDTTQHYVESLKNPRDIPNLENFLNFLENKFMALESTAKSKPSNSEKHFQQNQANTSNTFYKKLNIAQQKSLYKDNKTIKTFYNSIITCPNCKNIPNGNNKHGLYNCKEFLNLVPEERLKTVKKLGVCQNCLFSHNGKDCNSANKCKTCNNNHSTLLHDAMQKTSNVGNKQLGHRLSSSHVSRSDLNEVLLATVQLKVKSADGSYEVLRALLDQGSQLTLITENAVQRLQLKRNKLDAVVMGLGAVPSNKCRGMVQLTGQSIHDNYEFSVNALIMNSLTNKLPNSQFNIDNWEEIQHLKLADPRFNIPGEIDMLIGTDLYTDLIMEGLLKANKNNIIAQQTHLGWVICGKYKTFNCHVVLNNTDNICKFWEQEEITQLDQNIDPNDLCEKQYIETTSRLPDGRYQVTLPMKPGFEDKLGNTKSRAVAIFKQLEQKMHRNRDFEHEYKKFIDEYRNLGHMKQINSISKSKLEFFLPHHGVIRLESVTTKLRVVFNASGKSSTNCSLNDLMESGPNLQADLQSLLIGWRKYKYVFTADIEKMFRYIAVHPKHQNLQKIVWRDAPHQQLLEYQLCTVTYGTKAAPYLAQRTLKQLAIDEGDRFPKAKPILENNFYMDDAIFGHFQLEDARLSRDELINLLKLGGFNLRKWSSNDERLVQDLPDNMRDPRNYNFTETDTSKTLGLSWNPKTDNFIFSNPFENTDIKGYTKRKLLSEIAKIFDPLGWLSPVTVKSKLLFQQVWLSNLSWDEQLPQEIYDAWIKLKNDYNNIKHIKVPRWLGIECSNIEVELHAFCDASEKAYSAVVYNAVRKLNGETQITIVAAKTKVAPIKQKQSLPRLELCGALLLAKLINKIKICYNTQTLNIHAWTDSMVVLGWLNGDTNRWNSYVANRVRIINSIVPNKSWQHVKSEHNPADCATRGIFPSELINFSLWWEGPYWLKEKQIPTSAGQSFTTNEEEKHHTYIVQNFAPNIISDLIEKNSSLTKTIRILTWIVRFVTNIRHRTESATVTTRGTSRGTSPQLTAAHLTVPEIRFAHTLIIKHIQHQCFEKEIAELKSKEHVNKSSKIMKLCPFLDQDEILRVGGRLKHSELQSDAKHPIILPQKHRLTQLIINEAHKTTLHGGARLTLNHVRQRYWIPGGNSTVKTQLRRCIKCAQFSTTKSDQLMADLPKVRVTPSKPFYNCGVDFAGPIDIKANKGRGIKVCKGYVAVFVCLVTKAVHLELVSDLTSQCFIAALKRMSSRRGIPKNMYSDNGTNFVGANRELRKQFKEYSTFNDETFYKAITDMEIIWKFQAPTWASAGGLWEAAVKSMKHHLKRVVGEQKLTYEEFLTFLTQIEACLNSRPLIPLTENIEDLEFVLTPGHFLIGQPLTALPETNYTQETCLKTRWQLTQKIFQQFWKTWSTEYLQHLQTRSKWFYEKENFKVGDVVIVKEDNLAPTKWVKGRVTEVFPGSDGLVRVVSLKTKGSNLKRPITKLVRLPIENNDNQNYDDNIRTETKNTKRKQNKPIGKYLCFLLTFAQIITGSNQQNFGNVFPFDCGRMVYYDEIGQLSTIHDSWKILTFYNMTTYWKGINSIDRYITHVDQICKRFKYQGICESIVTELRQEVDDLQHNNYMLQSRYSSIKMRSRRGLINGVGQLAHSLFGVLDEQFAEQYQKDIETVRHNENHLLNLLKNHTSIIESQNNMLQRNEQSMNKQFQLIEQHIKSADMLLQLLQKQRQEEVDMNYFNAVSLSANIVISKLRRIQKSVSDTLNNIHRGHIDTTLISQKQILDQLSIIASKLPKHLSLPVEDIHNELSDIYNLLHVKARIIENYLIMEIRLPLINDIIFQFYKIIPIPLISNENSITIIPQSQYVAINMVRDLFITIEKDDLQNCIIQQENKYICTFNQPVHNMRQSKTPCELSFLINGNNSTCKYHTEQCTNEWIELHRHNTWLYVCCGECELRIICAESEMITRQLKGSGMITVGQGCTIKMDDTTIQTNTIYQSKLFVNPNLSLPSVYDINNITKLTPLSKLNLIKEEHSQTFNSIKKQLTDIKQQSQLQEVVSTHDIHQYIVSYLGLGLLLLLVVVGCIYMHLRRATSLTQTRKAVETEQIEMTTIASAAFSPEPGPSTVKKSTRIYAVPHKVPFNL